MVSLTISKDSSRDIRVAFPYNPILIEKIRGFVETGLFPYHDFQNLHGNSSRSGMTRHVNSKTTEIYTRVSTKDLGRFMSLIDNIDLNTNEVK